MKMKLALAVMKTFLHSSFVIAAALACLSISCLSEAAAPKMKEIFKGVTYAQCYGREYTRAELKSHPLQTVEQIKAKLLKYSADPLANSNGLKIEVRLANEEGVNYHAEFSCMETNGKTLCAIDCDGGSVTIGEFDAKTMTLKSNGFIIKGGCDGGDTSGDESGDGLEKSKFLKALKGGDDVFKMKALPPSYCTDASAAYDPVGEKK
jgi:hypothetical protein